MQRHSGSHSPHIIVLLTVLITVFAAVRSARAESTITCPAGMYDMLDWLTLDSNLRATNHMEGTSNPLYTIMQSGKFYWVKGGLGYPWDIQLYDNTYVYLWITELSWTVPQSYKKFTNNTNLPRAQVRNRWFSRVSREGREYELRPAYKLFSELLSDPGAAELNK